MTISVKAEARLLKRHASTATAPIAKNVLGIEKFATPMAEARFTDLVPEAANQVFYSAATGFAYEV